SSRAEPSVYVFVARATFRELATFVVSTTIASVMISVSIVSTIASTVSISATAESSATTSVTTATSAAATEFRCGCRNWCSLVPLERFKLLGEAKCAEVHAVHGINLVSLYMNLIAYGNNVIWSLIG